METKITLWREHSPVPEYMLLNPGKQKQQKKKHVEIGYASFAEER